MQTLYVAATRSNRSTDLAALELMDRNIKNMNDNLWPVNIYLDFSKAFDSLIHIILLSKLKFYGIQQDALCLLKSYLTNRSQYVQLDIVKSSHHQGWGQVQYLYLVLVLKYIFIST